MLTSRKLLPASLLSVYLCPSIYNCNNNFILLFRAEVLKCVSESFGQLFEKWVCQTPSSEVIQEAWAELGS